MNVMYNFEHCGSFFSRAQELERKGPRFESIIGKRAVVATNQSQTTISARRIMYYIYRVTQIKGLFTRLGKKICIKQSPATRYCTLKHISAIEPINRSILNEQVINQRKRINITPQVFISKNSIILYEFSLILPSRKSLLAFLLILR